MSSAVFPGQFANTLGYNTGSSGFPPGSYLTGAVLNASAPAFPSLIIPPYNSLTIRVMVTGYGGTDVVSLRFNTDSGTNYYDRTITAVAGGVVLVDTPTVSTTLIRLGLPTNQARVVVVDMINALSRRKTCMVNNQIGAADATAPATLHLGAEGLWNNTTAQITQIDCLTAGGLNILAGSSIAVYAGL